MKTLSVLLLLLTGCMEADINSSEYEEEFEEQSSEDYEYYEDLERQKDSEKNNCPVYYQKLELNGIKYLIKIPSECHLNYIETGRPSPEQDYNQNYDLIIETPYSQQEY